MANTQSKLGKRKIKDTDLTEYQNFKEKEIEIFLKKFVELVIKDPEDTDNSVEKRIDRADGPTLDAVLLAASKLRVLLSSDIDSLKVPQFVKVSIKILKTFIDFLHTSKLIKSVKEASSKKRSIKKHKTVETSSSDKQRRSIMRFSVQKKNIGPALGRPRPSGGVGVKKCQQDVIET